MEVWGRGMVKHVGLESTLRPRSRSGNVNVKKDSRPLLFRQGPVEIDGPLPSHVGSIAQPYAGCSFRGSKGWPDFSTPYAVVSHVRARATTAIFFPPRRAMRAKKRCKGFAPSLFIRATVWAHGNTTRRTSPRPSRLIRPSC